MKYCEIHPTKGADFSQQRVYIYATLNEGKSRRDLNQFVYVYM